MKKQEEVNQKIRELQGLTEPQLNKRSIEIANRAINSYPDSYVHELKKNRELEAIRSMIDVLRIKKADPDNWVNARQLYKSSKVPLTIKPKYELYVEILKENDTRRV